MHTFTFGTTPEDVIREGFRVRCPDGVFIVSAHHDSEDWTVLDGVMPDGVASFSNHGSDWSAGRTFWTLREDSLVQLLAHLRELYADDAPAAAIEDDDMTGWGLRCAILSTLDIEEV